MVKKYFKFIIFLTALISCGSGESSEIILESPQEELIQETVPTVPDETSTTTTTIIIDECIPDNNSAIDFNSVLNIQIFLNKYGFDAGDEDGYLGQQTANAIRSFQAYAGLKPDGDIGPNTINKMQNWTGCEEKIDDYVEIENSNTTTTTIVTDTTTTTIVTDTTTTTVPSNVGQETSYNYGVVPSISLTTNEVMSLFKGVSDSNSVCGTPHLNHLDSGISGTFSNGAIPLNLNVSNSVYSQSTFTTQITEESSSQIKIQIVGDGSKKYSFYFISPFTSSLVNIQPKTINTSLNLTEALFDLEELSEGIWFYSFAESGSGTVVKATGNREFTVGNAISQQVNSHNGVSRVLMTTKDNSTGLFKNVSSEQAFSTSSLVNILYITDGILDNRLDTTEQITIQDSVIKLSNEEQAFVSEILLVGTELMRVISKDGNNFTVERGYLNTEIKSYAVGSSVKAIKNLNKETKIANFAYAVFRNESGMRYQVPLGPELTVNEFNFSKCNYDRFSLEKITTFAWRSSGSSTVSSTSVEDKINPLLDKVFVINSGGQSYTPPTINSSDQVSGDFLNEGPKGQIVNIGDEINFNFNGIVDGSSKTKFVKLKFQLLPDTGSSKTSKIKNIYLNIENENYNFKLQIAKIVDTESDLSDTWENGYRYLFKSITLYDQSTSVEILNNQTIKYDYKSQTDTHQAYYLDQFSFIVKDN